MAVDCNQSSLQWVPWALTAATWFVAYMLHVTAQRKNTINSTIDEFRGAVKTLEKYALSFWLDTNSATYEGELSALFKRISFLSKEVHEIDGLISIPDSEITNLRQAISLYTEDEFNQRPLKPNNERILSIISCAFKLYTHHRKIT